MRNEVDEQDEHDGNAAFVAQYHGQIADLFSCDQECYPAVDAVAGNRY